MAKIDYKALAVPAAIGLGVGLTAAYLVGRDDVPLFGGMSKKPPRPGTTVPTVKGMHKVEPYLVRAGEVAGISNGFVPFSLAVSKRESGFNNKAVNDSPSEAKAACNLFNGKGGQALYSDNPYGAEAFCWGSGGWYGFLPATGMEPKVFRNLDPRVYLFEPAASTAMFADYVRDIVKYHFPKLEPKYRNWLSVRRSMASLKTMYNPDSERAKQTERKLKTDLEAVGYESGWMYETPVLGSYPGASVVWDALRALEPAAVA